MSIWDLLPGRRRVKLTEPLTWSVGPPTKAGKSVTAAATLTLSAAWACVRLIAETIGTLPVGLYRKTTDGSREAVTDHPLYRLVHDSPNADQTAAEFWEGQVAAICLWGDGLGRKIVDGKKLVAVEPIRPDLLADIRRRRDGRRIYVVRPANGARTEELDEDEVFHVKGFGVAGDRGLSPIAYARESLGSALAAEEAAANLMRNGLQQPLFIDSGQAKLTSDQRKDLRAIFERFAGSDNAGKIMVLEAGMKPVPLTWNPDDAQFLQTRQFQVEEICRWFRVPPFMVGHTTTSTSWGTGLEQQMIGFLTFALRPYLTRIEQAVRKQLLSAEERAAGLYVEFNVEGLLRADSAARAEFLSKQVQNGAMTPNEWRSLENRPPKEGGDQLLVNSTLIPLSQAGARALAVPSERT